jgi:ABC-2 type transport system permease protein
MADNPFGLRYPQGGLRRGLVFIGVYFKANLRMRLEYRASFISKAAGMVLNDTMWVFFWWIFFTRFPQASGYGVREALTLWLIAALGIGWSLAVFGNATNLASLIARGELDFYLAVPKNVLLHVLISKMDVTAWGELTFAFGFFAVLYRPDPLLGLLLLGLGFLSGLVMVSFIVIAHSLAFFLGNSASLSEQITFALLTFSTYPSHLFRGVVKALLYTVIPAAFMTYIPAELMRSFQPELLAGLVLGTATIVAVATGIFYLGLRHYESGNLVQMRS